MSDRPTPKGWKAVQIAGFVLAAIGAAAGAVSVGTATSTGGFGLMFFGVFVHLLGRAGAWWSTG